MGSSGGGNYEQPTSPAPPAGMISGQGQSAPFDPRFVNFLPTDGSMANGLTPEMLAAINRPQAPIPTPGGGAPAAAGPSYTQQLQEALARAGGAGGRPPGAVPPSGGGGAFRSPLGPGGAGSAGGGIPANMGPGSMSPGQSAGAFGGGAGNFKNMMGPFGGQLASLQSRMVPLPAPQAGANGTVSPADVAAYQQAQAGQQGLRDQLAALQSKATKMGGWRVGGPR